MSTPPPAGYPPNQPYQYQPGQEHGHYQHYQYPGYQPGQQAPGAPSAHPTGAQQKNIPGRIALIAGILTALVMLASQAVVLALPLLANRFALGTMTVVDALNTISTIAYIVFGIVAVVCGAIGLVGPPKPRGAAGAGIAIGILALLTTVVNFLTTAVLEAL